MAGDLRSHLHHIIPADELWTCSWGTRYNFGSDRIEALITFDGFGHFGVEYVANESYSGHGGGLPETSDLMGEAWGHEDFEAFCLEVENDMRRVLVEEGKDPRSL